MATLFRRNLFFNQLRQFHRSADRYNSHIINIEKEKKAFEGVLPEVIHSIVTGPKIKELPEVSNWLKQLLEYTLGGGKLGRGLMVSIGYRMFEEPENYSEETQHSARVLGWCTEMLQSQYLIMDDILDGASIRRGKTCWHRQPNIGLSAINDFVLMYQSMLELVDIYFGNTPIYGEILRQVNESKYKVIMGQHLDMCSNYNKEKNNIDVNSDVGSHGC